jgi:hypothetical protein
MLRVGGDFLPGDSTDNLLNYRMAGLLHRPSLDFREGLSIPPARQVGKCCENNNTAS